MIHDLYTVKGPLGQNQMVALLCALGSLTTCVGICHGDVSCCLHVAKEFGCYQQLKSEGSSDIVRKVYVALIWLHVAGVLSMYSILLQYMASPTHRQNNIYS